MCYALATFLFAAHSRMLTNSSTVATPRFTVAPLNKRAGGCNKQHRC